jgi:hypothetical protein
MARTETIRLPGEGRLCVGGHVASGHIDGYPVVRLHLEPPSSDPDPTPVIVVVPEALGLFIAAGLNWAFRDNGWEANDDDPGHPSRPPCGVSDGLSGLLCSRQALLRVREGGGPGRTGRNRCVTHVIPDLGPNISDIWDDTEQCWVPVP